MVSCDLPAAQLMRASAGLSHTHTPGAGGALPRGINLTCAGRAGARPKSSQPATLAPKSSLEASGHIKRINNLFDATQLDDKTPGETPERFPKELVDVFPKKPVDKFFNPPNLVYKRKL